MDPTAGYGLSSKFHLAVVGDETRYNFETSTIGNCFAREKNQKSSDYYKGQIRGAYALLLRIRLVVVDPPSSLTATRGVGIEISISVFISKSEKALSCRVRTTAELRVTECYFNFQCPVNWLHPLNSPSTCA